MLWLLSLILSICYAIWILRLVNFGVQKATLIEASTRATALTLVALYNALPPEARQRAEAVQQRADTEAEAKRLFEAAANKRVSDTTAVIAIVLFVACIASLILFAGVGR